MAQPRNLRHIVLVEGDLIGESTIGIGGKIYTLAEAIRAKVGQISSLEIISARDASMQRSAEFLSKALGLSGRYVVDNRLYASAGEITTLNRAFRECIEGQSAEVLVVLTDVFFVIGFRSAFTDPWGWGVETPGPYEEFPEEGHAWLFDCSARTKEIIPPLPS